MPTLITSGKSGHACTAMANSVVLSISVQRGLQHPSPVTPESWVSIAPGAVSANERLVRDQEVGSSNLLAPIRHNTRRMLDLAYLPESGSAALKPAEIR